MRVIFMGTPDFSVGTLQALIDVYKRQAAGRSQFIRNRDGFTGKGQRDRYISSGIVVF